LSGKSLVLAIRAIDRQTNNNSNLLFDWERHTILASLGERQLMKYRVKTCLKNPFQFLLLLVAICSPLLGQAQTFTVLHNFTGVDGADPVGGLLLSQGTLYGVTASGGNTTNGTVFKVNLDGTGFTNLYKFGVVDGFGPNGPLVLAGNTLYGTTAVGVFAINTDGSGFRMLYNFTAAPPFSYTNSDGADPHAGLILSGNTLYGTTLSGGSAGSGTVFSLNTDGSGFTNLHTFVSDGGASYGSLLLSGSTLYGTTAGRIGAFLTEIPGTVFSVNTNGTWFTNVNIEGHPAAGLILSGNTLYGTTGQLGGNGGPGNIFKINIDYTGFSVLHEFTPTTSWPPVNSDGAHPEAALTLSGNTLYGTCANGGSSGNGTIFAINTDGTGFTNLYSFTHGALPGSYGSDGGIPLGSLVLFGNTLYGTAAGGGSMGYGTVFSLTLPPPSLTINPSGANVILTWPTNYVGFDYSGFTLQSTTNLTVWASNSYPSVILNGQYTVTNPVSGTQQFFRLSQ
jgi:uncharacterized repeat protein (TIGR03803 family)